jgi:hypothetical protein
MENHYRCITTLIFDSREENQSYRTLSTEYFLHPNIW